MSQSYIVIALAAATLLVLIIGVIFMAKGGKINKEYSNKLMVARVVLQATAIGLLAVLMFCTKHGN